MDLLLKRYSSIDYVLKLPYKKALSLIDKAQEEDTREYYFRWLLSRYPLYTKDNYEPFEEFYEKAKPKKITVDTRSKDELMQEILDIEKQFNKKYDIIKE